MLEVKFKRLFPDVQLPTQGSAESVGYDLRARILTDGGRPSKRLLAPHSTVNLNTGLCVEAPPGFFIAVCSRSGIAKESLHVTNSPGIVDPDYRGELRVLLFNGSYEYRTIHHDDRVAQLIFLPATYVKMLEVPELSETERGSKGLGSTGR